MDPRASLPSIPLHLTSIAILSPSNAPLYVHSFTSKSDQLRHYHLSHAAVDVIEERIVMTSTPNRPADSYLGLLFCMEDMAFYGFQTHTKLRMVLSVALVDALIKDGDIVAIFRAIHQLLLQAIHNPFLSLPPSFKATHVHLSISQKPLPPVKDEQDTNAESDMTEAVGIQNLKIENEDSKPTVPENRICNEGSTIKMFSTSPEEIQTEWLERSLRFKNGIEKIGQVLNGGR